MKLRFLSLLFTAWAIMIHSLLFVQASPVEQSISPTSISGAPNSTTLPYTQKTNLVASLRTTNFTESSIHALNNHSTAHLFDDSPPGPPQPAPSNNHTMLKVVGLLVVFVIVIVLVLLCYCAWKHKARIAKTAIGII